MTVGDAEVKLRKSKKKKKRSSMIFISEERERTSTLDCKRVRAGFCREVTERKTRGRGGKWMVASGMMMMLLLLCDLCLPLAVEETGVPQ